MDVCITGPNIYSPSVLYDPNAGEYQMFYGGWQKPGQTNDCIYLRTSTDGTDWSSDYVTVMMPDMLRADYGSQIVVDHTNDPSVAIDPTGQEVMFFDAYASTDGGISYANSLWVGRSSDDGKTWSGIKPINPRLPAGVTGPQNPCAVRAASGNWRVYFSTSAGNVGTIWEVTLNPNLDPITKAHAVFNSPNGFAQNPEVFKAKGKWTLLYDTNGDNPNGGYDIHVAQSASPTHWSSETVLPLPGADQFGMVETPAVSKAAGGLQLYFAGTPSTPGPVSFADNRYILCETLAK